MILLSDLELNKIAVIEGFQDCSKTVRKKLLTYGLTPGTPCTVVRAAPLGDPIEINVRGFNLSLRKSEASCILVRE